MAALANYNHTRPLDRSFYSGLREQYLAGMSETSRERLSESTGSSFDVAAGECIALELVEGPQIVNFFAFNSEDPDERLWVHNSSTIEGAWLRRYSRMWGTMPRLRPLMTVIEDSVVCLRNEGALRGHHHFLFGGSGTPADWAAAGGPPSVKSTWERFAEAMMVRGLPAHMLKDNACLFQKTALDAPTQRLVMQASDAVAGDRLVLFAEIDLVVLLALSPYGSGGRPLDRLDGAVRPVDFVKFSSGRAPLKWPYGGIPYPDLSRYLDETGTRSDIAGPTPGLG